MRQYTLVPGQPESLGIVETDRPIPGAGQILVRIRAASLNFRDLLVARGHYPTAAGAAPFVPLSDCSGEVMETGEGVKAWRVGDRVCGVFSQRWLSGARRPGMERHELGGSLPGVLADYRCFPAEGVVRMPATLDWFQAATLPCAGVTAWHALFGETVLRPGETVLLIGTGGVSTFALQLARSAGARVIAISSSNDKLARFEAFGAEVVNYRDHPEWPDAVRRLTDGVGVDHVVEVGGGGTLQRSIRSLALGGTIHLIGVLSEGRIDATPLIRSGGTLRGILVGSRTMFEDLNRAVDMHRIEPMIHKVFPLEEAANAYAALENGDHVGKIVIDVAGRA